MAVGQDLASDDEVHRHRVMGNGRGAEQRADHQLIKRHQERVDDGRNAHPSAVAKKRPGALSIETQQAQRPLLV